MTRRRPRETLSDDQVAQDLIDFFSNPDHRIYKKGRTPASCGPDSPYYISQLEVLFEDDHFHWVTSRAVHRLLEANVLSSEAVAAGPATATFVWRRNVRYFRRPLKEAADLLAADASIETSRMTGAYAEDLVSFSLRAMGFQVTGRNARAYRGNTWTSTGHNLDFIVERDGIGYGVEVKNTFPYMPQDEFEAKMRMCEYLGLLPLFVVRARPKLQFDAAQASLGTVYMFKSKLFPLGQEELAQRIWRVTRLPVDVARDLPPSFYDHVQAVHKRAVDTMS